MFSSAYLCRDRFVCCYCVLVEEGIMRKGEVMRPFRAPRSRAGETAAKASPTRQSPRRKDKPDTTVHVVPYIKGTKMCSYKEAIETVKYGEPLRWSSDSEGENTCDKGKRATTKHDTEESEGPTELRVTRWLIPETEEGDQDITDNTIETTTTKDHIESETGTNALLPNETLKSTAASPAVSEFENYLEGISAKGDSSTVASSSNNMALSTSLPATRPAHLSKDEWWESVLRAEQERIKQMEQPHLVPVNEMFFDTVSSDDDVPIVNTLLAKTTKGKKKKV